MLVFFIHGVATKNSNYALGTSKKIREEVILQCGDLPTFYSGFWANILRDKSKLWNQIFSSLDDAKRRHRKTDIKNIFRYQDFREDFFSDFVGDILTYLSEDRGFKVRLALTEQLKDFIGD